MLMSQPYYWKYIIKLVTPPIGQYYKREINLNFHEWCYNVRLKLARYLFTTLDGLWRTFEWKTNVISVVHYNTL